MSQAFSVRLEEGQHQKLKDLAIAKNVSINMIFQKFVEELTQGNILLFTNEPRISLMAPQSSYVLVKGKNNGDREAIEKAKALKKLMEVKE